ncbi:unnamed protein product [Nippostrongylus brasiliensis]|uniref:Phage tail protein n=1 Tax=Nippostrongylus brasiliensis TaxID=27835 RepID=A0A0N4XKJ8_NIPBR|nr:unnamed protein product [Nippostrongylus brasiliensis]
MSRIYFRWRSEFGGKAFFPTIPKFTYGEQIDISISDVSNKVKPSLNYTENGYITVDRDEKNDTNVVSLTTAMSNGELCSLFFVFGYVERLANG